MRAAVCRKEHFGGQLDRESPGPTIESTHGIFWCNLVSVTKCLILRAGVKLLSFLFACFVSLPNLFTIFEISNFSSKSPGCALIISKSVKSPLYSNMLLRVLFGNFEIICWHFPRGSLSVHIIEHSLRVELDCVYTPEEHGDEQRRAQRQPQDWQVGGHQRKVMEQNLGACVHGGVHGSIAGGRFDFLCSETLFIWQ